MQACTQLGIAETFYPGGQYGGLKEDDAQRLTRRSRRMPLEEGFATF
jgi:hypothetical protein